MGTITITSCVVPTQTRVDITAVYDGSYAGYTVLVALRDLTTSQTVDSSLATTSGNIITYTKSGLTPLHSYRAFLYLQEGGPLSDPVSVDFETKVPVGVYIYRQVAGVFGWHRFA